MQFDNPLIVQGDRTLLLDVHAPLANECRNDLIPFAELERSPEHLHTYRLTPLSLWNATSAGLTPDDAVAVLEKYARYDVPQNITMWIKETASRFGKLRLIPGPKIQVPVKTAEVLKADVGVDTVRTVEEQYLYLIANARNVYLEIKANPQAKKLLEPCEYNPSEVENPVELSDEEKQYCFRLKLTDRGTIKQVLLNSLWPVKDEVQLEDGEPLDFNLKENTSAGKPFEIRGYQKNAAQALVGNKGPGTGFGTIVLPCGAGKTIVGMTVMDLLKTSTLIITTNISAVHQWIQELKDKSNLTDEQIAEYTGENKTLAPVTVNHDVNRVASVIKNPQKHLYMIYALLFAIPGIPSIYYGSEYALKGKRGQWDDFELRPSLPPFSEIPDFAKPDFDFSFLSKTIRSFAELRKKSNALKYGDYKELFVSNKQFAFSRNYKNEKVLVICNSDNKSVKVQLNVDFAEYEDMFSGEIYSHEKINQFETGACDVRFLKRICK